ncbi:MAG: hypothetical protein U0797_06350 [Gemmataceae bacterium]
MDATKPPLGVPLKRLIEMFLQNEAFADERYVNKVVHVRGKVVRISRATRVVVLRLLVTPGHGGAGRDPDRRLELLLFESERKASLNPGDLVTVQGSCGQRHVWPADVQKGMKEYSEIYLGSSTLIPKEKPTPAPKEP